MDPAKELENWINSNKAAREQRRVEYDRAYEDIAKACAELKMEMSQIHEKVGELSVKAKEKPVHNAKDSDHESKMHTEAEQANERIKRMVDRLQELMRRFDRLIPGLSVAMSSEIVLTVPQESASQSIVQRPKDPVVLKNRGKRTRRNTADIASNTKEQLSSF
ncbi:hypothetical protein J3B02_000172 [Coemansia erecta]|nr:hypothetical protein J3B02_000172 [Coemansia erecta]KAJ2889237.1 hypothetical protein FB639_000014 [Coemansia asiatica]